MEDQPNNHNTTVMILYTIIIPLTITFIVFALIKLLTGNPRKHHTPPSPPSIPVIGHLYLLRNPFHRAAHRISQTYGPITGLRFGARRVVLVSSSELADECFVKNDVALANRPPFLQSRHVGYDHTTMHTAPYGDLWRNLRRIATVEIFSAARIKMFADMRRDEALRLLSKLSAGGRGQWRRVAMKSILPDMTFNVIFRMVAGDDVLNVHEATRLQMLIKEVTANSGSANIVDFFPILKWLGNGYERKIIKLARMYDDCFQSLINRFRNNKDGERSTLIDHLLSLQQSQPEFYTENVIKGLVLVLLQAGTDTTSVTLEWAMSNLLNHPKALKKLKEELDTKVGSHRLVEEFDISRLEYLQSVVSETMRLKPGAPLLLAHYSSEDFTVAGYEFPRGTIVLVNAWSIHRDPALWGSDAGEFRPERFLENGELGSKLIPFGKGRRMCPGLGLAERVVGLGLASMVQCFDWERTGEELVDMREGGGSTMPKVVPLEAMCKLRPGFANLIK